MSWLDDAEKERREQEMKVEEEKQNKATLWLVSLDEVQGILREVAKQLEQQTEPVCTEASCYIRFYIGYSSYKLKISVLTSQTFHLEIFVERKSRGGFGSESIEETQLRHVYCRSIDEIKVQVADWWRQGYIKPISTS